MSVKDSLRKIAAQRNKVEFHHDTLNGDTLWLQEMNGKERDQWELSLSKKQDKNGNITDFIGLRAVLIQLVLVDEQGVLVYTNNELEQINELPGKFREDLFDAALEFNGLTKKSEEAQLKNSRDEAGSGSEPASPTSSETPTRGVYLNG